MAANCQNSFLSCATCCPEYNSGKAMSSMPCRTSRFFCISSSPIYYAMWRACRAFLFTNRLAFWLHTVVLKSFSLIGCCLCNGVWNLCCRKPLLHLLSLGVCLGGGWCGYQTFTHPGFFQRKTPVYAGLSLNESCRSYLPWMRVSSAGGFPSFWLLSMFC